MEKFKQYILAGISMLAGAFLPYLYSLTENMQIVVYLVSILLLLGGLIFVLLVQLRQRSQKVRYTVLIFLLDAENRLFTLYNNYHKRLMIPCGVYSNKRTANETVVAFLEEVGLQRKDYALATAGKEAHIDPSGLHPHDAQVEFVTAHEKKVKLHYSFIYFLELKTPKEELKLNGSFKSLKELEAMDARNGLFSDLLDRYRNYLMATETEKGR